MKKRRSSTKQSPGSKREMVKRLMRNRTYDDAVHNGPAEEIDAVTDGNRRAELPPYDDLSTRGMWSDENYDRDSYDFGQPPFDPSGDSSQPGTPVDAVLEREEVRSRGRRRGADAHSSER